MDEKSSLYWRFLYDLMMTVDSALRFGATIVPLHIAVALCIVRSHGDR